jgi:hypothetical protein
VRRSLLAVVLAAILLVIAGCSKPPQPLKKLSRRPVRPAASAVDTAALRPDPLRIFSGSAASAVPTTAPCKLTAADAIAKAVHGARTVGSDTRVVATKVDLTDVRHKRHVAWVVAIAPVVFQPIGVSPETAGRDIAGQAVYAIDANTGEDIEGGFTSLTGFRP